MLIWGLTEPNIAILLLIPKIGGDSVGEGSIRKEALFL